MLGDAWRRAEAALDIDTGGGEVLDEVATPAPHGVATEAWQDNLVVAAERLGRRGMGVVGASADRLPFTDQTFDLVTSRHPVRPQWEQIHRVLRPGGTYLAQHVGPGSAQELIGHFLGPQVDLGRGRHPDVEVSAARAAGLEIDEVRSARLRMEFFDVGAVVWILRKCVWWVPDFDVTRYREPLLDLDAGMRAGGPFVAHSTRHLVLAHRP